MHSKIEKNQKKNKGSEFREVRTINVQWQQNLFLWKRSGKLYRFHDRNYKHSNHTIEMENILSIIKRKTIGGDKFSNSQFLLEKNSDTRRRKCSK
ncbi:hypothetical protein V6Z12_A06G042200 [Gossypium hirsutum]|uniref:Uncharacterized protein n=1 Tax=Gossypium tomentosum TaxID=34277 RepID=A0A5D2Q0B1_GOSTO|nr:hypothetical protein ES332_A06G043100v1 [Gossypium tomentosum]